MTDKILSEISPVFGFCPFKKLADSLIDCRAKNRIPKNAESVIVVLFPYYLGEEAYNESDISKYAVVPDYHKTIGELLQDTANKLKEAYPDEEFIAFTDNSPIPEVRAATFAGLGVRGLNGLFINKVYGSWVFIGEIVTTKKYKYPETDQHNLICRKCGKCVNACPTKAISSDGITSELCLSFITQKKGELTPEQEQLIRNSGCAWGCDICQNVCPMNDKAVVEPVGIFKNGIQTRIRADGDISDRAYAWRGEKVIKRNIRILKIKKGD